MNGLFRHCRAFLYQNRGFGRLSAPEPLLALAGTRYDGKSLGSKNEPQRAHVASRHDLAADGPADQSDDHRRRLVAGRSDRYQPARGPTGGRTSGSSPVPAAGRVPTGRRLLVRRPELRHCASHQARAAAGTRRQAGARTLCGRSRLRAARSRPSALDDPYRRGVRGRRGAGVPHASCDWRRSRPGRRHDVPRRWSQAQDASRRARARRRRLAAES